MDTHNTTPRYEARGPVRGSCGHAHRTEAAAAACAARDQRDCASIPGSKSYSDRRAVRIGTTPTRWEARRSCATGSPFWSVFSLDTGGEADLSDAALIAAGMDPEIAVLTERDARQLASFLNDRKES